jgi:PAS domain S-box-containing protein
MAANSYVIAVAAVAIALGGTLVLQGALPNRHLSVVLFFAAVAISAGIGGLWSGVLATFLSALACDFFFLAPVHSLSVAASDIPLLALFIIASLSINGVSNRLREQTRQADRRYFALVQGIDGIVWEMNPRTMEISFISHRAELLLGYPIERWLTEPGFRDRITHSADLSRMKQLWNRAIAEGGEHTADYRAISSDGKEVWIRETIQVGLNAQGQPIRITGLGIDITERKTEADELIRLKDEFAVLNKIGVALSTSLQLDEFLRILRTELRASLGAISGCVYLTKNSSDLPQLADCWGTDPACVPPFFAQMQDLCNSKSEPLGFAEEAAKIALESGAYSTGAIAVPLLAKHELRGMLLLWNSDSPPIRESRWTFYAALGRQVGTLLQNVSLYQEVLAARERLTQLSRQLVSVQEAERRAVARELHDEIGQLLTGLKFTLEMSHRGQQLAPDDHYRTALTLIRDLMAKVEGLSLDLRPPVLDDLGLLPALHWHIDRFTTQTGVKVQLEHTAIADRFAAEVEIAAYRIVQEALTNVARHSGIRFATVRLWATREIFGIQITDAGCGFDASAVGEQAAGLTGMAERAMLLNGHLTIETAPGAGTSITVDLPLAETGGLESVRNTGEF